MPEWAKGNQQAGDAEGDQQDGDAEGQKGGIEGEQDGTQRANKMVWSASNKVVQRASKTVPTRRTPDSTSRCIDLTCVSICAATWPID